MPFQATLRDGLGNLSVVVNAAGTTMTITDESDYPGNGESGHSTANFADFRKLNIKFPNKTNYLYSSLGDGDALMAVPSIGPDTVAHVFPDTMDDGVFYLTLTTIPTYDNTASYQTSDDYVYDPATAKIYQCIQNSTGNPVTNTAFWSPADEEDVPSKYVAEEELAQVQGISLCRDKAIAAAAELQSEIPCDFKEIAESPKWVKALKLDLALRSIDILIANDRWPEVEAAINSARNICCCDGC